MPCLSGNETSLTICDLFSFEIYHSIAIGLLPACCLARGPAASCLGNSSSGAIWGTAQPKPDRVVELG